MRHRRSWHDVPRFWLSPQVEENFFAAEAKGQLSFRAARLVTAIAKDKNIEVASLRKKAATIDAETGWTTNELMAKYVWQKN